MNSHSCIWRKKWDEIMSLCRELREGNIEAEDFCEEIIVLELEVASEYAKENHMD